MAAAADRTVLVLGGAGIVGSGIVKVLLEKGFRVAVISRDAARLEKLKNFVPATTRSRLFTLVGDVGSEEGAEAAKNAVLQAVGKVTDIVSSLGFSWWQGGPPHTQTLEELNRVLNTLVLSTFTSWKAFFPLVKDNPHGSYTFITERFSTETGPTAHHVHAGHLLTLNYSCLPINDPQIPLLTYTGRTICSGHLTSQHPCLWDVGGNQSTRREPTPSQGKGASHTDSIELMSLAL